MTTTDLTQNAYNVMLFLVYLVVTLMMLALIVAIINGILKYFKSQKQERQRGEGETHEHELSRPWPADP